jgi:hypothetical protein
LDNNPASAVAENLADKLSDYFPDQGATCPVLSNDLVERPRADAYERALYRSRPLQRRVRSRCASSTLAPRRICLQHLQQALRLLRGQRGTFQFGKYGFEQVPRSIEVGSQLHKAQSSLNGIRIPRHDACHGRGITTGECQCVVPGSKFRAGCFPTLPVLGGPRTKAIGFVYALVEANHFAGVGDDE